MGNVLVCGFEVSEFDLKSPYYVHFLTNIPEKDMNSLTAPAVG